MVSSLALALCCGSLCSRGCSKSKKRRLQRTNKHATTEDHLNERTRMFWWIIDGLLDGDWRPLFFVLMLAITMLVGVFVM